MHVSFLGNHLTKGEYAQSSTKFKAENLKKSKICLFRPQDRYLNKKERHKILNHRRYIFQRMFKIYLVLPPLIPAWLETCSTYIGCEITVNEITYCMRVFLFAGQVVYSVAILPDVLGDKYLDRKEMAWHEKWVPISFQFKFGYLWQNSHHRICLLPGGV